MIVATVIAFVYTYRQPKIYEATCQVIIEPMAPQVLPGSKDVVELGTGTFWANKEFYETQYRIIQSTSVGQRTAEKLGLQYDPDYAGVVGPNHDLTALGRPSRRSSRSSRSRTRASLSSPSPTGSRSGRR